MIVSKAKIT